MVQVGDRKQYFCAQFLMPFGTYTSRRRVICQTTLCDRVEIDLTLDLRTQKAQGINRVADVSIKQRATWATAFGASTAAFPTSVERCYFGITSCALTVYIRLAIGLNCSQVALTALIHVPSMNPDSRLKILMNRLYQSSICHSGQHSRYLRGFESEYSFFLKIINHGAQSQDATALFREYNAHSCFRWQASILNRGKQDSVQFKTLACLL